MNDALEIVTGFAVMGILFVAFEVSAWQASPGKKLLGLRLTRVDGARVSWIRASVRYALFFFLWLLPMCAAEDWRPLKASSDWSSIAWIAWFVILPEIYCCGLIVMFCHVTKPGFHDMIAGCVVARQPKNPSDTSMLTRNEQTA